ncbi:hypothetical protein RHMOL_Rhmol02G0232100 [Rhododendron molle]|uniref:Uncharacterized protein n=1 Tax=Rhododendron molle TaxID=49168 RepID=A0ACC0PUL6_RHOML|nr:hypothetical protein RHMOL_Rhmol02G0232100 [Rhododendron molle]
MTKLGSLRLEPSSSSRSLARLVYTPSHGGGVFWNSYLFQFAHDADMEHVVARGPWSINGALLVVEFWRLEMALDQINLSHFSLWVCQHGLPLECNFAHEAGFSLGAAIGDVMVVDGDNAIPRNIRFFRIKVWIETENQWIRAFDHRQRRSAHVHGVVLGASSSRAHWAHFHNSEDERFFNDPSPDRSPMGYVEQI